MFETSEFNITYYLGAGASAKALPTVKNISSEFKRIATQLEGESYNTIYKSYVLKLINNLRWLSEKSEEYGTPDTYAKYLFLKEKNRLADLKNALSAYFLIEQFVNKKFDNRALVFLINILENTIFPGNIKIITWNYDFQIQLAAEIFREERYVVSRNTSVHTPPLISYYPTLGHDMQHESKDISMVHLNGIAGSYHDGETGMFKSFFERQEERDFDSILTLLSSEAYINRSLVSFAWESNLISKKKLEFSKDIAAETDILVVIGYSFPYFNRKIDKEIFDIFRSNRLKTIYYQDPFKSGEFLRNQFELADSIIIKNIKETDNYFVPLEL